MNYYIHYQGGAGGDFLRVCLWLLLNPKLEIDWYTTEDLEETIGVKGKGYYCNHEPVFGLLDTGAVKPLGAFSHTHRGDVIKQHNFHTTISELAFYFSLKDNVNYTDMFEKYHDIDISKSDTNVIHTVMNSHSIYHDGVNTVKDLMKYLKDKHNHVIDLHIGIMPNDPIDAILIRYIDSIKNEVETIWSKVDSLMSKNDNSVIAALLYNFHSHKPMYDYVLENNGMLIDFKNLMLLGPYNLAKEFSKRIENIEISQSYLEFHKKYNEVNNWKDIFNNDKIKNLRKFFDEKEDKLQRCL